jgi:hypothetical protein
MRAQLRVLLLVPTFLFVLSSQAFGDEPGAGGGTGKAPAAAGATKDGVPAIPSGGHGVPTPPAGMPGEKPSGLSGAFGGGMMFEKINEDYFITLDLQNRLSLGPVTFGLWVPLRLRVVDNDPDNDSVIRKEDWDEISDYAKLLRFVEVKLGGETWSFRGRFGALEGESIGHGTVLSGYYNSIDRDHYQAGLALATAIKYGGFEFMLDNLFGPEIFGLRLHARPAAFFTDSALLNRFVVGLSFTSDTAAPVAPNPRWVSVPGPTHVQEIPQPEVDGDNNFVYTDENALNVVGLDFEYTLIRSKILDIVPYVDFNFMIDKQIGTGAGMHLGTFVNIRLPTPVGPTLLTRLEYQVVGEGYGPRYFDSLYEGQRAQYGTFADQMLPHAAGPRLVKNWPLTKLGWLRQSDGGPHGWLGELFFDFAGWVRVGGTFEDYQGPDNAALTLSLILPKLKMVKLGAYYTKRGFDGFDDAFDLDGALMLAFAKVRIWGPLYFDASFSRSWHALETGEYETDDNFSAGVSVSFEY